MRSGDFLGEECITGAHSLRATTAIAISECLVLRTERKAMLEVLRRDAQFFSFFLSFIISRTAATIAGAS